MNFDSGKVNLLTKTPTFLDMGRPSVMLSDEDGNLQFFTNGRTILNKQFKVMKNGARINPGKFMDDNNWYDGLPLTQSSIALPFPNNDSIYYLLHQDLVVKAPNNYPLLHSPLYYSKIDMRYENGLGQVVSINNALNNDTVTSMNMTACRHANGRDWWMLAKQPFLSLYNSYLITESSVKFMATQKVDAPDGVYNEPVGQAIFTPNGEKYIQVTAPYKKQPAFLDIYDFDRCAGFLDNHQADYVR